MKRKHLSPAQKPASASSTTIAVGLNQNEIDFAPARDEVARRAYFSYESLGSVQGNHLQHWLAAESQLVAEHKISVESRLSDCS